MAQGSPGRPIAVLQIGVERSQFARPEYSTGIGEPLQGSERRLTGVFMIVYSFALMVALSYDIPSRQQNQFILCVFVLRNGFWFETRL